MAQKKLTAKQKQEQAAKQKKTELLVMGIVAAVVVVGIILGVVISGFQAKPNTGAPTNTHQHDENCNHETPVTTAPTHVHSDSCTHGDGATLETAVATHYVTFEIENYGTIKAALYGNTAPATVANFVSLAESGFYNGLTFHRIKEGFMMQGGDPEANGTGGSGQKIVGEFAANGFENNLKHERGVLSMARSSISNDSASSQFFIMHADNAGLDGEYAAFGKVIEGMDVVDAICAAAEPINSNYLIAPEDQPVILSVTVEKAN
jgi:peptidyl-prolyl cis-trans isomerase B (cyclophilin B)